MKLRGLIALASVIILAALAAWFIYGRSLNSPLIFDDFDAILDNTTIRALWPPSRPFHPPDDSPLTGRPLANATFALQYAIGGLQVWGYHLVNLILHVLTTLALFGVVRRTLDRLAGMTPTRSLILAAAASLIWSVHPLNTEAVVYITQRTELMLGLFFLLTLYATIRYLDSRHPAWAVVAIVACACGMVSKEVMIGVPLLIWLYDRTFVSGGFFAALRKSAWLYAGLAATWALLIAASLAGHRSSSVGIGHGISSFQYLVTQAHVILWYLRLSIWPHPLSISYTRHFAHLAEAWPYCLAVLGLLILTIALIWRRSPLGFLGACFFVILAPSSSVVPIVSEVVAERRMYIPLAAVVVLVVMGADWLVRKYRGVEAMAPGNTTSLEWGMVSLAAAVWLALAVTAHQRVRAYDSQITLWTDAVEKYPDNAVALQNLAISQTAEKRYDEAFENLRRAADAAPTDWRIYTSLARTWMDVAKADESAGRPDKSREDLTRAAQAAEVARKINPKDWNVHWVLGEVEAFRGRFEPAAAHYREAVRLAPRSPGAHNSLGAALFAIATGGGSAGIAATAPADSAAAALISEAVEQFQIALRLAPEFPAAHNNLAIALVSQNKSSDAIDHFLAAIKSDPTMAQAYFGLGATLAARGFADDAILYLNGALHLKPDYFEARAKLGITYLNLKRYAAAADDFEQALILRPDDARTHNDLGIALASLHQLEPAIMHFRRAVELDRNLKSAGQNLAQALRLLNDATQPATQPTTGPTSEPAP